MNKSGDLFLRCNNLTLNQYKLIALSRGLTGAVGFTVSLVVLVVILLAARRRAWDILPKRLFFVTIFYTAAYCVVAATGVHYSRPPDKQSTWCEAMGFLLHYSGCLVIVSFLVLTTTLALQVVMPVCPALQARVEGTCRSWSKRLWEVILYLGCSLFPVLITWEPFIAPFASYGNYGPICWFRWEINDNCTSQNGETLSRDKYFVWTVGYPLTIISSLLLPLVVVTSLCCIYCKFHSARMESRLKKAIGQTVFLTAASITVCVAWLSLFLLHNVKDNTNFSSWTEAVTNTPISMICAVVLMTLYIYVPVQWLYKCCKRSIPKHSKLLSHVTERPTIPSSQWDHRNVPSVTVTHIRHETVTGSETSQLINEQLNYQTLTNQST